MEPYSALFDSLQNLRLIQFHSCTVDLKSESLERWTRPLGYNALLFLPVLPRSTHAPSCSPFGPFPYAIDLNGMNLLLYRTYNSFCCRVPFSQLLSAISQSDRWISYPQRKQHRVILETIVCLKPKFGPRSGKELASVATTDTAKRRKANLS